MCSQTASLRLRREPATENRPVPSGKVEMGKIRLEADAETESEDSFVNAFPPYPIDTGDFEDAAPERTVREPLEVRDVVAGVAEVRGVSRVEGFRAELDIDALANLETAKQT